MSATAASVVRVGTLAGPPAAALPRRPALAVSPALRRTRLHQLPAAPHRAGPMVVCAAAASPAALAAPAVLAGAAALGLSQPALFSSAAPTYLTGAAAGAALLWGLHLDFKVSESGLQGRQGPQKAVGYLELAREGGREASPPGPAQCMRRWLDRSERLQAAARSCHLLPLGAPPVLLVHEAAFSNKGPFAGSLARMRAAQGSAGQALPAWLHCER